MSLQLHKTEERKRKQYWYHIRITAVFLALTLCIQPFLNVRAAETSDKKYGIIIADRNSRFTFYDLNENTKEKPGIEADSSGNLMVPLKQLVALMPVLTYRYDATKKTATVVNSNNGHKVVFKKDSKYIYYYSGSKAAAAKKTIVYQMYLSNINKAVMVPMSALQWVMGTTSGYQYYKSSKLQGMGYDTTTYSGVIAYHPYRSISSLPKATVVNGISATIKVTIPEGYSAAQAFDLLFRKGVVSSTASLYDSMANYNFTYYPLVAAIVPDPNRCFKLEGYLYPDTYEFYRLSKSQDVIGKFLRNAEAKITKDDRAKAKSMGYTMDQIMTIASIVEKETADPSLMPQIASVIYNRLNKGMKLQFDSSIYYVERYVKPYITGDINRYNSYYNTYKCKALPAGPISNPGRAAIQAALHPAVTDYLYFYSDQAGVYHFSKDYVDPNAPATQTPSDSTGGADATGTGSNDSSATGTEDNTSVIP